MSTKPRTPPKPQTPQPMELPRRRPWILGIAIAMEAAWIVLLTVLALAH